MREIRAFCLTVALLCVAVAAVGCAREPAGVLRSQENAARGDLDRIAYDGAREAFARASASEAAGGSYRLDAGDRLRVLVYGQDGLTNSYTVDAGGMITMPLIGAVPARGATPSELARRIATRLRGGYIREPHVATEIESYRPFFILGEVAAPGQYPYVPNMTAENAVAIAGGFTARASRPAVDLSRPTLDGPWRGRVPLATPLKPGDTIVVGERWF
jgi:polysaccharide export outer membrane protein